jgi:hypothetical protein
MSRDLLVLYPIVVVPILGTLLGIPVFAWAVWVPLSVLGMTFIDDFWRAHERQKERLREFLLEKTPEELAEHVVDGEVMLPWSADD